VDVTVIISLAVSVRTIMAVRVVVVVHGDPIEGNVRDRSFYRHMRICEDVNMCR